MAISVFKKVIAGNKEFIVGELYDNRKIAYISWDTTEDETGQIVRGFTCYDLNNQPIFVNEGIPFMGTVVVVPNYYRSKKKGVESVGNYYMREILERSEAHVEESH